MVLRKRSVGNKIVAYLFFFFLREIAARFFLSLQKANYKIAAAKLHYEIYALTQRLRLTTIRVEYEEAVR